MDTVNSEYVSYALEREVDGELLNSDTLFLRLERQNQAADVRLRSNRAERRIEISVPHDLAKLVIYRAEEGEPLRKLRIYDSPEPVIFDRDLIINTTYQYRFEITDGAGEIALTPRHSITF